MFLKIFLIVIYCAVIKIIIDFIILLYKVLTKKFNKNVMMHKFRCPYCEKYNEMMVTTESVFFLSKFFPIIIFLIILLLILCLIPYKPLILIRKVLLYIFLLHAFTCLLFGLIALLATIRCKSINAEPKREIILKIANRLFNVRKSQCKYCKKTSYKITGY